MNSYFASPHSPDNIIHLRHLLREKFPHAHHQNPTLDQHTQGAPTKITPPTHLPTGLPALDQLTQGGLPKGALTEINPAAPGTNSPATLLLNALLDPVPSSADNHGTLALIDSTDSFDPQSLAPHALQRLLWVRCHNAAQAVKAADLLLRDGNLPLILLDLQLVPLRELQRIPASSWHRLHALAEKNGTTFLASTPSPKIIPNTRLRLTLQSTLTLDDLDRPRPQLIQTHLPKIKITRDRRHQPYQPLLTQIAT